MLKSILSSVVLFLGTTCPLWLPAAAEACDTPVYRYSMYSWEPAPYTIYFIHDDDPAAAQPLKDAVDALNDSDTGPSVNLWCVPIDLAKDPELRTVPPSVTEAWAALGDHSTPRCLVVSPKGSVIYSEMVTPADLDAMIHSPARQQVAEELQAGKVGVFLFLESGDEPADQRALAETEAFVAALADGTTELLQPTGPPGYEPDPSSPEARVEVGLVRVQRDDPAEAWLVRMLLAVEQDLPEFNSPMVFGVFGRCRALEPYIGNGIVMENLAEGIDFIRGSCSCTVRDENPGLDLLTQYDWEKAAAVMAERFGAEEGSLQHLRDGDLAFSPFPEIIPLEPTGVTSAPRTGATTSQSVETAPPAEAPASTTDDEQEQAEDAARTAADQEPTEEPAGRADKPNEATPTAADEEGEESTDAAAVANDAGDGEEVALQSAPARGASSAKEPSFTGGLLWTMLVGVAIGLGLLLGATFFLFRPTA